MRKGKWNSNRPFCLTLAFFSLFFSLFCLTFSFFSLYCPPLFSLPSPSLYFPFASIPSFVLSVYISPSLSLSSSPSFISHSSHLLPHSFLPFPLLTMVFLLFYFFSLLTQDDLFTPVPSLFTLVFMHCYFSFFLFFLIPGRSREFVCCRGEADLFPCVCQTFSVIFPSRVFPFFWFLLPSPPNHPPSNSFSPPSSSSLSFSLLLHRPIISLQHSLSHSPYFPFPPIHSLLHLLSLTMLF